jgi:hypothetical protein
MGTVRGAPAPDDQVANASPDLVDPDLFDAGFTLPAPDRYSYVFGGNAQTLDHVLVSTNALGAFAGVAPLSGLAHARINADFPEALRSDQTRVERLSDHDPVIAYFRFPADTIAPVLDGVPDDISVDATSASGATVTYALPTATDNLDGTVAVTCEPPSGSMFPVGDTVVTCSATDRAGNTGSRSFLITVRPLPSQAGSIVGLGQVGGGTTRSTFVFAAEETAVGEDRGGLVLQSQRGFRFDLLVVLDLQRVEFPTAQSVAFSGRGWWNGRPGYTVDVRAADNGSPGKGLDTFAIIVRAPDGTVVLSVSGTLSGGEIVARPAR